MNTNNHRCYADNCNELVALHLLMCPAHWARVPEPLKSAVWREWRKVQREHSGHLTKAYGEACEAARKALSAAA